MMNIGQEGETHLKHVENDIELDGFLTAYRMIHSTRVCDALQDQGGQDNQNAFDEVAFLRNAHPSPERGMCSVRMKCLNE